MSIITSIGTAVPPFKYDQGTLCEFMGAVSNLDAVAQRKLEVLYAKSAIDTRYAALPDFANAALQDNFFAPTSKAEVSPSIDLRLEKYNEHAPKLALAAIHQCDFESLPLTTITHIITVSCTGMSAPGLEITLIEKLGLRKNIKRTSINFMGCYAAMHGLQQAHYICSADPSATVLVVCVELCTLHFQHEPTTDNLVANSLFADGAAAAIVTSDAIASKYQINGLRLENFFSQIITDGAKDMAWQISERGFLMTLSAYIPKLIEKNLKDFLNAALTDLSLVKAHISNWAIHPGGRKILEAVAMELGLNKEELDSSYQTLRNYGNMSSPTILFVIKDILTKQNTTNTNEYTFALAFGPGLVMESCLMKYV